MVNEDLFAHNYLKDYNSESDDNFASGSDSDEIITDSKKQKANNSDLEYDYVLQRSSNFISLHKYKFLVRRNRYLLLKFLKVKFKRQYRITKYIHKYLNKNAWTLIKQFQYCIENILLESKFAYSPYHVRWLLKSGCVFVNGVCEYNGYKPLKIGDRLQILSDNKVLESLQFFLWRKHKYREVGSKIWKNMRFRNDFRKTSPTTITNWINNIHTILEPTPKFLEIDWISQTSVILYEPLELNFSHFYMLQYISPYILRGYNWKYLT